MYITTKDELTVSSLIEDLRKDSKTVPDLLKIRDKIKKMVSLNKYHLIDLIFQYLSSDKDIIPSNVFEGFLNECIQITEKEGKKIILFAIPVILLESRTTSLAVYQDNINFSNKLHGIEKYIESDIRENIKNDNVDVYIHNELIDYFSFHGGFDRIKNLSSDLSGENQLTDDSILIQKESVVLMSNSSCDNLKFFVGILETDDNNKDIIPEVLSSLDRTNFQNREYSSKINDIFLRKGYVSKQIMVGKPSLLLNALKDSLNLFNYMSNLNYASKVFYIEPDHNKLIAQIAIDVADNAVKCYFYRVNEPENYIFKLVVDEIYTSYEDEIKQIMAILTKLEIRYEIVRDS